MSQVAIGWPPGRLFGFWPGRGGCWAIPALRGGTRVGSPAFPFARVPVWVWFLLLPSPLGRRIGGWDSLYVSIRIFVFICMCRPLWRVHYVYMFMSCWDARRQPHRLPWSPCPFEVGLLSALCFLMSIFPSCLPTLHEGNVYSNVYGNVYFR